MDRRTVRWAAIGVVAALVLPACGGGGDSDPAQANRDDGVGETTGSVSAGTDSSDVAAATVEPPPLLIDGVVSEEALVAVLTPDGQPDPGVLAAFVAEFSALPVEQQESVVADLAMRAELEAAAISGLEAAVGGAQATSAALGGASTQVLGQADTVTSTIAAATPEGLRRLPTATPPGGAAVAAVGLFMGYLALATIGSTITESTNTMEAGDTDVREGDGTVIGASVDEVNTELTFKGKQDGVDVEFVAAATLHPCPAPDGTFDLEVLVDVKASKGGAGQNARMELKVDGTVGDDAELASKNIENRTQWADFGGGSGQFVDFTMSGPNGVEQSRANRTGGKVTDSFTRVSVTLGALVGLLIATQLVSATEKAWKSGRCVALGITPSAGPTGLEPSQVVAALAEPRSKVDASPTGGTVTATLSAGGAAVEPDGSPLPADATFNYTAPDEPDKEGTVAFESKSRRGIGTTSVTFSTARPAAYLVVGGLEDWQVSEVVCDVTQPFTLTSPGVGVANFSGGLTGTYEASGVFNFSYAGTYEIALSDGLGSPGTMSATSGGTIAGEAGSGTEQYTLTPAEC